MITTVGAVAVAAGAGGWAAASLEASAFTDIFDDLLFFALFFFFFYVYIDFAFLSFFIFFFFTFLFLFFFFFF